MSADVHALIGAYVLDAVDDLERAAFDRHLRECPVCRDDVDELREASTRLAGDTWSVPPPALRTDVLAAIGSVRQLGVGLEKARRPSPRLRLLSAAAAVVLAVGGAVFAVQEHRVRVEQARADQVSALLAAPDLVVREQPVAGGGTVTVAVSKLRDAGVIMLAAANAPAGGQVYQLWTIRDEKPVPEGTLVPGQATAMRIVEDIGGAQDVGVSIEPPGGSATPTTPLAAAVHL